MFVPAPPTDKSVSFTVIHQGDVPVYDVMVDLIDATERQTSAQNILNQSKTRAWKEATQEQWTQLWNLQKSTAQTLPLGNITPGSVRFIAEVPLPRSGDHEYDFAMWARNGFFSEQLVLHRGSSGWIWAWRLEKTLSGVKNAKPHKITEQILAGFPTDKIPWKDK